MNKLHLPLRQLLSISFFTLIIISFGYSQTLDEYINSAQINDLMINGDKNNRVNLALANADHISGNGYKVKNTFVGDVESIVDRFDPRSSKRRNGVSHYRNFFNFYSVWFPDAPVFDNSAKWYTTSQNIVQKLFLPWNTEDRGWASMIYTLEGGSGGGVGRNPNMRYGSGFIWGLDWSTVLHEFNHMMPGVRDEYTGSGEWSGFVCEDKPNTAPGPNREDIPWRKWIKEETPVPTPYEEEYFNEIGAFEGTISGYFGCHRPTARSCYMGAGGFGDGFGQDMCAICLQRFVCQVYKYVDAIEGKVPAQQNIEVDNGKSVRFSVDPIKPIPNTQKYEWFMNDKKIAEGVTSIDITFNQCATSEVTFVLTDETDFVRYDEKFKHIYEEPKQSYTWTINNEDGSAASFDVALTTENADCSGEPNGKIKISTSGGEAPFTYVINGVDYDDDIENLAAGDYELSILDANDCVVRQLVTIKQDALLDFKLASNFDQGVWTLSPVFNDLEPNGLQYDWSNGSTNRSLVTTDQRRQRLEITTSTGCTIEKEIDVTSSPRSGLEVISEIIQPNSNVGGTISLDLSEGLLPYEIKWYKAELVDLTNNDPSSIFATGGSYSITRHPIKFLFDDLISNGADFWAESFRGDNIAGYDFKSPTEIESYSITSNYDVKGRDARSWKLQGSSNGSSWQTLDVRSDIEFETRLLTKKFILAEPATYRYFRILITENAGEGWLAIQELDFGISQFGDEIMNARNQTGLSDLAEGEYVYEITDANQEYFTENIKLKNAERSYSVNMTVEQDGYDKVRLTNASSSYDYYWYSDKEGTNKLHEGTDFYPPAAGNYFVRALRKSSQTFADETKGFAVSMYEAPEVYRSGDELRVRGADSSADYFWYDAENAGEILNEGTRFKPSKSGDFYVSARYDVDEAVSPIAPDNISGITMWGDASDLNGDDQLDNTLESSAAYQWNYRKNGNWRYDNFFVYRGNYSNGLGVVDFGTIWFQYSDTENFTARTLTMVYEENAYSEPESAPYGGFTDIFGKGESDKELLSRKVRDQIGNGDVYLNGKLVDPRITENTIGEFKIISVVLPNNVELDLRASHVHWEGKLGEFIVWDKELSSTQIQGTHEYLRKKWITTAELGSPRSHIRYNINNDDYSTREDIIICEGEEYLGLTESGNYRREMLAVNGQDSTVSTNLEVIDLRIPDITQTGNELRSSESAESYTWYLNGTAIANSDSRTWEATEDGDYFVSVDEEGCNQASEVFTVVLSDLDEVLSNSIKLFPNPANSKITVRLPNNNQYNYEIINMLGKVVQQGHIESSVQDLDISVFTPGLYKIKMINNPDKMNARKAKYNFALKSFIKA